MCRVKPLMIACTADSSEDIKKNAESVGFDLVITAPLTEKKVKQVIKSGILMLTGDFE